MVIAVLKLESVIGGAQPDNDDDDDDDDVDDGICLFCVCG